MLIRWVVGSLEAFVTQIGYDLSKVQLGEEADGLNRDARNVDPEQADTLVTEAQPLVSAQNVYI